MVKFMSIPSHSISRIERLASSNSWLVRILALIGIIFVIQRTASFYISSTTELVTAGSLHHQPHPKSHDPVISYEVEGSGKNKHTGEVKAIIVASTTRENTTWIREHFPDWQLNIYVVDDENAELTISRQGGNEAAVFLSYIITHYYDLPDYMVFLHASRYQWHNDDPMYDGIPAVSNLRLSHVKEVGYASLRCTWEPGCPSEMKPAFNLPDAQDPFGVRHAYAEAFGNFFPDVEIPEVVGAPCCAQFAVSRDQVLKRPVQMFERVRQWLWETRLVAAVSGRVMEYLWHVLFSMPAVNCPNTEQCFCQRFGYCDLDCPEEGFCQGRYWFVPWLSTFPKGWPVKGQGEHGFPVYGWWQKYYPNETWGLEHTDTTRLNPTQGAIGEGMSEQELNMHDAELSKLKHEEDIDWEAIQRQEEEDRQKEEEKKQKEEEERQKEEEERHKEEERLRDEAKPREEERERDDEREREEERMQEEQRRREVEMESEDVVET